MPRKRTPQLPPPAGYRYRMDPLPGVQEAAAVSWNPEAPPLADPAMQGHLPLDGAFLGPLFDQPATNPTDSQP